MTRVFFFHQYNLEGVVHKYFVFMLKKLHPFLKNHTEQIEENGSNI